MYGADRSFKLGMNNYRFNRYTYENPNNLSGAFWRGIGIVEDRFHQSAKRMGQYYDNMVRRSEEMFGKNSHHR